MAETPSTALVVEGGGMRGAYAASVLVHLFENGRRFDAIWATSSGAASSAYGAAGQPHGIEIWKDHLHGRRLVSLGRFVTGRPALDLDYLVDEVFTRRVPLDTRALAEAGTPVTVPVTDTRDGSVAYFDLRTTDPLRVLRAAMSLPGAVHQAVTIQGRPYVDGGVIDQIPIQKALAAGATDVTVVLTRPEAYRVKPIGPLGMTLATRHFPGIRDALKQRHVRYEAAAQALRRPPSGVRLRIIRPQEDLPVRRWTTKRARLLEAIQRGAHDAAAALSG